MKQQGIGNVIGTTTSDVLKKVKLPGKVGTLTRKPAPGKDTVSISNEAREMMANEPESIEEDEVLDPEVAE